ncbi:halocyanin domain-containing protein [Halobacteriales archaeon QS_8_69_26]|nr:MAG: halocyanin domain-containing protein [Halobacteriales archaeon QS_8_69_26]
MDRRTVLRTVPVAVGAGIAGCLGSLTGGDGPDEGGFEEYVADANGYEGPVDLTGEDEVTVTVGAGSKGVAFGPPAVVATKGVTVTWEWSGRGGTHNVVSENDLFRSERASSEGYTFTQTLGQRGVYKYYCQPHEGIGMVGAIQTE